MLLKPLQSALILALLATSTLQGCDHNANLTEQQLIQRAKDFEDKGDLKTGVIELKNALQKNPNSPQARLLLGEMYLKSGMGAEAENELQKAQKLGVNQETIKPLLGEALLLMGKYDQVLAEIQPGDTTSKPNLGRIYQMRGEALLKTGKLQEACNLFQQSLDTDTSNPPTYWGLAQCAVANKEMSKAKALLDTALKINDKQAKTWIFIGDLEQFNKNSQGALTAYTNALKTEPGNLEALQNRAIINVTLGQLDPARTDIEKIRKIAPKSLLSKYTQALLSFKQQKYSEARDALQEALQIAPDHTPTLLLSGAVNYAQGSYEQAANQLEKVLEKAPGSAYARKLLAATQVKLGQDNLALATLQPLHPDQSSDPQLLELVGGIYLHNKEYTKASQLLEKAASIDPKNASIRTGLGVSLLASGETARALADLESAAALDTGTGTGARTADTLLIMTLLREKQYDRALLAIADLDKKQPNNPLIYNFRGGAYVGKKDLDKARNSFEQALAIKPDFFPAAANLAQLDLQANNPAAARNRFEGILKVDKNNLQAMMALAELASINKQEKEYVDWLEKAAKAHPEAIPPRALLVQYYLAKKEPQKALALAKEVSNANPDNPEALNLLGTTQLATNDITSAITTFTKLTTKAEQSPDAYLRLALAQIANKNMTDARATLQKALQLKPDHLQTLDTLLRLNVTENKLDAALQIARQIQTLHPESPVGYDREADIQLAQKHLPQAIKAYEQALTKGAGSTGLIKLLSAQFQAGNVKPAETRLNDWLKQHPGDNAVRAYAASYYMFRGRDKDAIAQYQEIQRQAPNNVVVLNNLASLYQRENDSRARATAEQALKLAPDNAAVQDTLGWILVQQGQAPQGLGLLRKAIQTSKTASIRYHYAVALARTGDKPQARKELEKLLVDAPKFPEAEAARTLLKSL
ncbi:XrtA/PEP-CTERM system TPR-repeat protein PrsT [Sulfuriferula sp. GW1]|uniref:XrtA/PEP-CTERM system TPR-repeat protein PrsT n=1 Tax=Sulfuriferula sp. GW1 TaxID=3345111 RepID=UPI0039AF7E94